MTAADGHLHAGMGIWRRAGLIAGPVAAAAMLAVAPPEGLSAEGWRVAAVAVLMAVWWMTEALPLAVTALLPLILFPVFGVGTLEATAPSYAHPLIFLFLGGFLLARALHVWQLDRRLALAVLRLTGPSPRAAIASLMGVTAFLSMWVSNTATAMVMLPIAQSVAAGLAGNGGLAAEGGARRDGVAAALLLGIAYAATIGGMGTLIGTPPNALFAAYMAEAHGIRIGFARWMAIGVPVVLVLLPVAWFVLTRVAFKIADGEGAGRNPPGPGVALAALPPISRPEKTVAALMVAVAACWIFRPLLDAALPGLGLSDAGIALTGAALLFLLPADLREGRFLLNWREAADIRWDVLILFGGGLALAAAMGATDLARWIGGGLTGLGAWPLLAVLLAVGVLIVFLSELASNTAMAAVFLPVAGATALGMGVPAVELALPVALFATLGFMLPVATPPNAIVYGGGAVEMRDMIRAGFVLNLVGIAVVALAVLVLGPLVAGSGG